MTCASCQAHVEKDVSKVEGVTQVNVNLLANNMVVEYDESITNDQAIIRAVKNGGYDANLDNVDNGQSKEKSSDIALKEIHELRKE